MGLLFNEAKFANELASHLKEMLAPILESGLNLSGKVAGVSFDVTIKLGVKEQ